MEMSEDLKKLIEQIRRGIERDRVENQKVREALRRLKINDFELIGLKIKLEVEKVEQKEPKLLKAPEPKLNVSAADLRFLRSLKIDITGLI